MNEQLAACLDAAMHGTAFRHVERSEDDPQLYALGLWYASGRAVVVSFDDTLAGVRVTDAGGAWADLFASGALRAKSTDRQAEMFERVCAERGLAWDRTSREVVGHAFYGRASFVDDLRDVVMRVALASIALEGARAWLTPRAEPRRTKAEIVETLVRFAERTRRMGRPLSPDTAPARGRSTAWDVDLQMRSDGSVVGCYVASHETLKTSIQLAVGFMGDVPGAAGVVMVTDDVAQRLPIAQTRGLAFVRPDHHLGKSAYQAALGMVALREAA